MECRAFVQHYLRMKQALKKRQVSPQASAARMRRALVEQLAHLLHGAGAPAHRLEVTLAAVWSGTGGLGADLQILAEPTSILLAFGQGERQSVRVLRTEPNGLDLAQLSTAEDLATRMARGELSAAEGLVRIATTRTMRPRWSRPVTVTCFGVASVTAAVLLGGAGAEAVVGGLAGLLVGLFETSGVTDVRRASSLLSALVTGLVAATLIPHLGGGSAFIATGAGLIALLPGYTTTVGLTEVATGHLASGTARLAAAAASLLVLGFGVGLGGALGGGFAGDIAQPVDSRSLEWACVVVGALAFGVVLGARADDLGWVAAAGALAYGTATLGTDALGPRLGSCAGALAVGISANLFATLLSRPAALIHVPGILMLVPGSIGFRSVAALMDQQVLSGVEAGFDMAMVAASLVGGLLLANLAVRPRSTVT